jgi:hypothetical protein
MTGSMDHRANVYSLTDRLAAGNRAKSSIESDGGLKGGGACSHMRTRLDPDDGLLRELTGQIRKFALFLTGARRCNPVFMGLSDANSRAALTGIFPADDGKIFWQDAKIDPKVLASLHAREADAVQFCRRG